MSPIQHQKLPGAGEAREALRRKGQFWTPAWVAEAMVAYALSDGAPHLFDPAVGEGAFFRAAKSLAAQGQHRVELLGTEVDPLALEQALASGLTAEDLVHVDRRDFALDPPRACFQAIVANPPYVRHHRLSTETKAELRRFAHQMTGLWIDGRAGLHVYFLLRALQLLGAEGQLAFIMPADTAEGTFAPSLWKWITAHYCLDAVITFDPIASPFPGVDTNALVFLLRNSPPQPNFCWAHVHESWTDDLKGWLGSGLQAAPGATVTVHVRALNEALTEGLSRAPVENPESGPTLGQYARVVRGIATGANAFFFLTCAQAKSLQIPEEFLRPAVGRTRDVDGETLDPDRLAALDVAGRPTLLLSLDGRPLEQFPHALRAYLQQGVAAGLPLGALIRQRHPWYKMEQRSVPPFLFAYLGRRNVRFIRNRADAVPLTGFLCVYPRDESPPAVERLWRVLQHPDTVSNLARVGKSYGGGAIKVEPRALERLPLPPRVVKEAGLRDFGF